MTTAMVATAMAATESRVTQVLKPSPGITASRIAGTIGNKMRKPSISKSHSVNFGWRQGVILDETSRFFHDKNQSDPKPGYLVCFAANMCKENS
jgi:hypothetical protein